MGLIALLEHLGEQITDTGEETFLLFSQDFPPQNLGFVDPKSGTLELEIGGKDYNIHQSPTILSSNRTGGTTGAVLWKISPLVADWLAGKDNLLFREGLLTPNSTILELGCGTAGLLGMVVSSRVGRYIATDQAYVCKLLRQNLEENFVSMKDLRQAQSSRKVVSEGASRKQTKPKPIVEFLELDWETTVVSSLYPFIYPTGFEKIDVIVCCDCVYNYSLLQPLVHTCLALCSSQESDQHAKNPKIILTALQLRTSDVFESWLEEMNKEFRMWRVPDSLVSPGLQSGTGFVMHISIKRTEE
ncbi:Ribosomal protein lysine methyltransferase [Agyrium rufum]|nr:Ribosomal protein lysine methyltransferase [Agyrium rufum]